ncbi:MAG: hypothetical protein ACOZCL_06045 [Bacillota bacterium]
MGIEFSGMNMEQLEDLLYETSEKNTEDLSTFTEALYDMYGGIDETLFKELLDYLQVTLGITTDAQIKRTDYAVREKILDYANAL